MKKIVISLIFSIISLFAFEHLESNNINEKLSGKNAIIDFYATWCPPCKVIEKNLIEYDKVKPTNIIIYKVDIDQYMDIAKRYNVRSLPTLVYVKDGKVVGKEIGIRDVSQLAASSMKYFK